MKERLEVNLERIKSFFNTVNNRCFYKKWVILNFILGIKKGI